MCPPREKFNTECGAPLCCRNSPWCTYGAMSWRQKLWLSDTKNEIGDLPVHDVWKQIEHMQLGIFEARIEISAQFHQRVVLGNTTVWTTKNQTWRPSYDFENSARYGWMFSLLVCNILHIARSANNNFQNGGGWSNDHITPASSETRWNASVQGIVVSVKVPSLPKAAPRHTPWPLPPGHRLYSLFTIFPLNPWDGCHLGGGDVCEIVLTSCSASLAAFEHGVSCYLATVAIDTAGGFWYFY